MVMWLNRDQLGMLLGTFTSCQQLLHWL